MKSNFIAINNLRKALNVAFLAFALIFSGQAFAQNINLKSLKGEALFIGVDNILEVDVPGISKDKVYIGSDEVEINKLDNGQFSIKAQRPGKVTLLVHGEGFKHQVFEMAVNYVPDPLAALQLENGTLAMDGELTADDFKKAVGVGFEMKGFKGKIQLDIASYGIVRVPKNGDPSEVINRAANFNELAKSLVNDAQPGDTYYFENVQVDVEGADNQRKVNSLVFRIK